MVDMLGGALEVGCDGSVRDCWESCLNAVFPVTPGHDISGEREDTVSGIVSGHCASPAHPRHVRWAGVSDDATPG
jgi:hypothetical protein